MRGFANAEKMRRRALDGAMAGGGCCKCCVSFCRVRSRYHSCSERAYNVRCAVYSNELQTGIAVCNISHHDANFYFVIGPSVDWLTKALPSLDNTTVIVLAPISVALPSQK